MKALNQLRSVVEGTFTFSVKTATSNMKQTIRLIFGMSPDRESTRRAQQKARGTRR